MFIPKITGFGDMSKFRANLALRFGRITRRFGAGEG
jgi:hypothetical protein